MSLPKCHYTRALRHQHQPCKNQTVLYCTYTTLEDNLKKPKTTTKNTVTLQPSIQNCIWLQVCQEGEKSTMQSPLWSTKGSSWNKALVKFSYWAVQWSWFAQMNALCNLLCKKAREVAVSLLGWFLSRCCFMLYITMEAEPRIAKQYKCHHCVLHRFLADQKIASSWTKLVSGHPVARATSYCLLPDTFWL